ncbi:MAG: 3-phosphoshikimate 1-carboxyvinyltransferase, partial [Bacteroidota bacterium]
LLASSDHVLDVLDAGTTMRFLTAYIAATNQHKELTGTERMRQRPIGILVDALQELGADISYKVKEGFPPIIINGFGKQLKSALAIRGDVSSQYISALLMIAPTLPDGLTLELKGKIGSRPYIAMTLSVMKSFGVDATWNDNIITIPNQTFYQTDYTVEPDWSAASYWYSVVALSEEASVTLTGLIDKSIQGDRKIADIMKPLGVSTKFTKAGAVLSKQEHASETQINFIDCPDLAQTVSVICAVKGIKCKMTGLESLRIKETDRIKALQQELSKINADIVESDGEWTVSPSSNMPDSQIVFDTYEDHRMAMAFAPLATRFPIIINDPSVVNKSYPRYWEDYTKAGFILSEI